ncbi:MAG TPA: cupin domain-containing protein [Chloroflexia bacterium]|nr:cupin domain-containing protein [Chloroflexia bacterium]
MNIIEIDSLRPPSGGSPRFEGHQYGSSVSFFVVTSKPGRGADKHRHPYDETFVILDGDIEVIVGGEQRMVSSGHIAVIPANTWHEFKNRSDHPALMVNIHPVPQMIQEDWS